VNIERTPHIAVLGATRTGKSRRFNRPFIACALAAGDRVFILGKATDYQVFDGHPNAFLMRLSQMTEPAHAEPYVRTLKAIVEEMNRREEYLITARQSTWQRAGRATTWVILDEFGNALRQLPNGLARQAENWVECLVAEGAKNGLNIVVANQRATGLAATLSQTGKAIFRVEADEEKSHRSLQNASALDTGYFYARFGDLQLAGAFEPSDEEIRSFLEKRPARALENDWIDGEVFEQGQLSAGPTLPSPRSEIAELAESVRGEWSPTMSKRALGRLLGKEYAGSWAGKIDRIMEYLSATTTENRPEMGLGAA
jgi:hypothetical protein